MENTICKRCFSSDCIQLPCGHIGCRSCLSRLNENIQCLCHDLFSTPNDGLGPIPRYQSCNDCGEHFPNAQFETHKKKKSCPLMEYGCNEQIDSCSIKKHQSGENHIQALKSCFNACLKSSRKANIIEHLTQYCSQNINGSIGNRENNDFESIDEKLLIDFDATRITEDIINSDNSNLTNEENQHLLEKFLIDSKQTESYIESKINQLNEEQTTISTIENQLKICHKCKKENNLSLLCICQKCDDNLHEKLDKLVLENKQEKENYKTLVELLKFNNNLHQTQLLNIPDSKNGLLIWKIENISERINKFQRPSCSNFIDSPRFLSLTGKHPLNVRLYLYGDASNDRKYISIHIILNQGEYNDLSIPLTCCLVDQTDNYQHIIKRININLNKTTVGEIPCFPKFIDTIDVHREYSPFVKNDVLYLIVKLHENESEQYINYPSAVQNALQSSN